MENDMNMRPTPKKSDGTGLLEGTLGAAVGTAAGAAVGVGGAYAYEKLSRNDEQDELLLTENDADDVIIAQAEPQPEHHHEVHHIHHTTDVYIVDTPESVEPVIDPDEPLIYPEEPVVGSEEFLIGPDEPYEGGEVAEFEEGDTPEPDVLDPNDILSNDPGTDGGDALYTSLEGDGTMPDYVNNGDVSDLIIV